MPARGRRINIRRARAGLPCYFRVNASLASIPSTPGNPAARSAASLGDAPVDPDLDVVAAVEEPAEPPVQPLSQRTGDVQHVARPLSGLPCHACLVPIVRREPQRRGFGHAAASAQPKVTYTVLVRV